MARTVLIIVLPVAMMQVIVTWAFFDYHWRNVSRSLSQSVAGDIALVTSLYETGQRGQEFKETIEKFNATTRLSIRFLPDAELPDGHRASLFSLQDQVLRETLTDTLDRPFWFDAALYRDYVDVRVAVEGGVLRAIAYRSRTFATTGPIFLLWMVGATFLLVLVSYLFIRNQVRPIVDLSAAATAFGQGKELPDYKPWGATEVREAAQAVLLMRDNLKNIVAQRTSMLANISHDLRTPLTRLKLQLALWEELDGLEAAKHDLNEMEAMLKAYLDFAKGDVDEFAADLALQGIITDIVENLPANDFIELGTIDDVSLTIKPLAIKRALTNIIQNARHYGEHLTIYSKLENGHVQLFFEDDGPGIDPDDYDTVLKPFNRLDMARNLNEAGVGLGLSIALDIIQSHGGELVLNKSRQGGLSVAVTLPVQSESKSSIS